jgi:hypothetical protein
MAFDNNMTGALFKVRERKSDKHPLYTGSCEINGQKLWISAWVKQSKNGESFMSLAFKPADEQRASAQASGESTKPTFERRVDDEIPF